MTKINFLNRAEKFMSECYISELLDNRHQVSASRDSLILPVKLIRAWVVEYFGRKPNCNDYIRLLMSRQLDTWVRWAFSTWVFQWFFQQYALTNDYLGK